MFQLKDYVLVVLLILKEKILGLSPKFTTKVLLQNLFLSTKKRKLITPLSSDFAVVYYHLFFITPNHLILMTNQTIENIIETLEQFNSQMKPDYEMMVDFCESQGIEVTQKVEDLIFTVMEYDLNPMVDEDGCLIW